MKILVFGTMYLRYNKHVKTCQLWLEFIRKHHKVDWLLVDNDSPIENIKRIDAERIPLDKVTGPNVIADFGNNIGHMNSKPPGQDGWGRAFFYGISFAEKFNYDYVIHIENDLLTNVNIYEIINLMNSEHKKIAAPFVCGARSASMSNFMETGLMFMDVEFMIKSNFAARYNWQQKNCRLSAEKRFTSIAGDNWLQLKWNKMGFRDDTGQIVEEARKQNIPLDNFIKNLKYITHVPLKYFQTYAENLKD